jgi:predicted short-subunit dehydrogenase-like oxidoreductase (DUF2520 family)
MAVGLVAGGNVAGSFVARLPRLAQELGPVAAESYRVASRTSNTLNAGTAVRGIAELAGCNLVLICCPVKRLGHVVAALAAQPWKRRIVLACGSGQSTDLQPLAASGAVTGSMHPVQGFGDRMFVAEGAPGAIRQARRLARQFDGRVEEIDSRRTDLFAAGWAIASAHTLALVDAAVESLHAAGLGKATAGQFTEVWTQLALRAYGRAGKRSWKAWTTAVRGASSPLPAIQEAEPSLAHFFRVMDDLARERFRARARAKGRAARA